MDKFDDKDLAGKAATDDRTTKKYVAPHTTSDYAREKVPVERQERDAQRIVRLEAQEQEEGFCRGPGYVPTLIEGVGGAALEIPFQIYLDEVDSKYKVRAGYYYYRAQAADVVSENGTEFSDITGVTKPASNNAVWYLKCKGASTTLETATNKTLAQVLAFGDDEWLIAPIGAVDSTGAITQWQTGSFRDPRLIGGDKYQVLAYADTSKQRWDWVRAHA